MRSRRGVEDAELWLDWEEIDCSLDETRSEGIGSKWESQAMMAADASGGAETWSFLFIKIEEQVASYSTFSCHHEM